MEVDEIQAQQPPSKFPRIGNGGRNTSLAVHNLDDKEVMKMITTGGGGAGGEAAVSTNRLNGWHHSRIIRVSRASGGKDRHSKVWTSKGLRDRRVRLSVSTAIQFYDLQDRLGYDQPSKAVEWLISAASDAISELPSLNSAFPDTPKQLSDEKRGGGGDDHTFDAVELDMDGSPNCHHQPQQLSQNQQQQQQNKSACSSNSETSKGSGLSLSRSEIRVNRVKARERARERAAKVEKDNNDNETSRIAHVSRNAASFTELLTGGIGGHHNSSTGHHHQHHQSNNNGEPLVFHKAAPQQPQPPMDYFGSGLLGLSSSSANRNHSSTSGFSSLPHTMFSISGHPGEMQNFSFVPDYIPVSSSGGGEYNLNFSMSTSSASGGALAGFNRGTLQSNSSQSPSLFQRFSPLDGSNNVPFFMGAAPPMENHHHQQHQFPAGLQLYGDGPGIQTTREKQRTDLLPS